jgi:diguanylate cyclase (GGDEF)-like protein
MLFALLVVASTFISDTIILIYFCIIKEIRTLKAALDFYRYWNILDHGKTGLTNGLLFVFLMERQWEFLIGLFLLNYLVNRSIIFKTQNLQDRLERDMFEEMAYTDALTGVNNRAFMDKKMKELSDPGETIGVVVADIDRFKLINDTYNHAVGDEVLKHFAKFLSNSLNKNDFIFRSGGEEFTLLLRGKTYEEACSLLEQIRKELEQCVVIVGFNGEDQEIKYTSSFGMFYKHFAGTASIEKGYIYADNLLFKSKRSGRNRITSENDLEKSESSQKDALH